MELSYVLRIRCSSSQKETINQILTIESSSLEEDGWEMELIDRETDPPIDYVNIFLNILENKYKNLSDIGVERKNISVWIYYKYDQQCNMEFLPDEMKHLGENGIVLCVSCWQSAQDDTSSSPLENE